MKKLYSFLAVVLFASMIASCSDDSSTNNNGGGNNNNTAGKDSMVVTIDGTTHTYSPVFAAKSGDDYSILGGDGSGTVTVFVNKVTTVPTTRSSSTDFGITYGTGSATGSYIGGFNTSTVTVTSTTTTFKATFSGTLQSALPGGGSKTITNGMINATIN